MFLSVFDLFKIGLGPSSSHTMGPMVAAGRFCEKLVREGSSIVRLSCFLHGSLAFTGRGHGTDWAIILGLIGETPADVDPDTIAEKLAEVHRTKAVHLPGLGLLAFDPDRDMHFDRSLSLPGHANGMKLCAHDANGRILVEEIYYSIGGGFVLTDDELSAAGAGRDTVRPGKEAPYPFMNAREMLSMGASCRLSIAEMKHQNELEYFSREELESGLDHLWEEMDRSIERGLRGRGYLPGGLHVKRRAGENYAKLKFDAEANLAPVCSAMEWPCIYAMAVGEENAAGGKVVTAPTNGAAGVVPATIRYYLGHCSGTSPEGVRIFLLTAAAIGGIIKHNASISGAEVGCQGEVGSASAMAAAGLCAVLGGSNEQVENAAEIALEHHLGMTCDPVLGLVQVPCIERNALGAVKAITAAALALRGDGSHLVSLDACIESMRQIGCDMSENYKETSMGGLASNVVEC